MLHVFPLILFLLSSTTSTSANTEILNFEAISSENVVPLPEIDWPVLSPGSNKRTLEVIFSCQEHNLSMAERSVSSPSDLRTCQNEVWLKLALDEEGWKSFSGFTVRLSWPANHPTEFSIDVQSPEAVASRFSQTSSKPNTTTKTRVRYARITALHTGIIVPTLSHIRPKPVPFVVTVEGLYFGVLPESVVPIILHLGAILLGLWFLVPRVVAGVERVARDARVEVAAMKEKRK